MKPLEEIPRFPIGTRQVLRSRFGIDTAESFYAHAARNPEGIGRALDLSSREVTRLSDLVARHLGAEFVQRCKTPRERRPRGLIVEGR